MIRLRKSFGLLALAITAGTFSTACEENESMLFIVGVLHLQNECVARPEPDSLLRTAGVLDLTFGGGYRAPLLVGSQLTQRGSREQIRTETARLTLQGAEVTLENYDGTRLSLGSSPNPYSTLGSGFVNPSSGGSDAGYGVITVDIVPGGLNIPVSQILARVRVFGTTLGGAEIESNEYVFPINVCRGCLISYPASAADDTGNQPGYLCTRSGTSDDGEQFAGCAIGQDEIVPCNVCSSIFAECRDPCQNCATRPYVGCTGTPEPDECRSVPMP